jgi:hypothetical protein
MYRHLKERGGGGADTECMCSECKHIEGLCRHWCSVSIEKCGAANTERGYAGIGLQTDAERDMCRNW